MSEYIDVLVDTEVTNEVMSRVFRTNEFQAKALCSLGEVNEEMMNNWFGPAGNSFQKLASTVEGYVVNGIRFTSNASEGLDNLVTNFAEVDQARADSLVNDENSDGGN